VVFVNSSQGTTASGGSSAYAASKHALKAFAGSLRQEVRSLGIRVTSIYSGRTATPAQERLYRASGEPYHPDLLLQPETIAPLVVTIATLPETAEVTDLNLRPAVLSY
jgi:NADP-dependent 3-hydroxy acid dehydrogenase YdfG